MMNKKWEISLVFGIWLIGSVSAFVEPSRPMAPDFELRTLSGEAITRASLAGKPALLMFWATWCGVCRREMPNVKTLYEGKKGSGLQVVAIGFQDTESTLLRIRSLLLGLPMPAMAAEESLLWNRLGRSGLFKMGKDFQSRFSI